MVINCCCYCDARDRDKTRIKLGGRVEGVGHDIVLTNNCSSGSNSEERERWGVVVLME